MLSDDTKKLVTIATHKVLFSYTRLPFGVASAPAIFQNIMEQMFSLPGIACFLDDILITGEDDKSHLTRLEYVFQRLHECGLKVKEEKCF